MIEHIVKNQETITDILNMYHLSLEELQNANLHITDFRHLVSGTKIRIPLLTEEIEQVLESTESFVKKYYPKVEEILEKPIEKPVVSNPKEETEKSVHKEMNRRAYPGILPPKNPYTKH